MPNYRRYRVPGGTYFFTVNLLERQQDTLVQHIDVLRNAVWMTRNEPPFNIDTHRAQARGRFYRTTCTVCGRCRSGMMTSPIVGKPSIIKGG